MQSLFKYEQNRIPQQIDIEDGELVLYEHFFSTSQADKLLNTLLEEIPWQQEEITIFGKTNLVPRLSSWYGDSGVEYTYSGILHKPEPWSEKLMEIKNEIETELLQSFNSLLANLYRDGNDRVGWHADDEKSLGRNPLIASLSLGATRRFDLKHQHDKEKRLQLHLNHGNLLVMKGALQHHWHHQIPVQKKITDPRINLTFRQTGKNG